MTDNNPITDTYGTKQWFVNGKLHREDGPAVTYAGGSQFWYVNGKCHRIDGPACIWVDGIIEWYVNDENITDEVVEWMTKNNITYPFNNESLVLFKLMFG